MWADLWKIFDRRQRNPTFSNARQAYFSSLEAILVACAMGDLSTLPNSVLPNLMHPPPPLFPMNAISERKNDPLCNTFSSDSGIFRAH